MGVFWDCAICGAQTKQTVLGEDICSDCEEEALKYGLSILKRQKELKNE